MYDVLALTIITSMGRAQKKAKAGKNVGCAGTGNKDDIRLQARKIRKPQAEASLSQFEGGTPPGNAKCMMR